MNRRIRAVSGVFSGASVVVSTVAGSDAAASRADGPSAGVGFFSPEGVAVGAPLALGEVDAEGEPLTDGARLSATELQVDGSRLSAMVAAAVAR